MDIAFGDCVSIKGFRYALILVDRAARYNWAFGLQGLSSSEILSAIRKFRAAAGSLARCFYCDCDCKLFGTAISKYLVDNGSKVVAAPAKRQSSNGLVESHWKTIVHMAWAYIKEKQMPRSFWFYAVVHAARMMNAIPGRHSGRLVSPFLLVHGVGHDERTWTPIFSLAYFHHDRDGDESRSHHQAHTMDGIVVGRSPTSNALLLYNPRNKKYYEPNSYCLDPYRLPGSAYPSIVCLSISSVTTIPILKKNILLAPASNASTSSRRCSCRAQLWIYRFHRQHPRRMMICRTPFSLITVRQHRFHCRRCPV